MLDDAFKTKLATLTTLQRDSDLESIVNLVSAKIRDTISINEYNKKKKKQAKKTLPPPNSTTVTIAAGIENSTRQCLPTRLVSPSNLASSQRQRDEEKEAAGEDESTDFEVVDDDAIM